MPTGYLGIPGSVVLGIAVLMGVNAAQASGCDPAEGARVYQKCAACHSLEPGRHLQGPSLNGLFTREGRPVEGFRYSTAMRDAKIKWNEKSFKRFIENPGRMVPGTTMPFGGIRSKEQRDHLFCYLREGE